MQGSSPSSLGAGKPSLDLPEGLFEIFLVVFLEGTSGVGDDVERERFFFLLKLSS